MPADPKHAPRKPLPPPLPDDDEADDGYAPLQRPPKEAPNESALESLGRAITAPVRGAAEDEERKQTGKR